MFGSRPRSTYRFRQFILAFVVLLLVTQPARGQFDFQGPRELQVAPRSAALGGVSGIAAADLDGNAAPDVAVVTHYRFGPINTLRIYLNDGNAQFSAPLILDPGATPGGVVAGDFEQGGASELAVSLFDNATHVVAVYGVDVEEANPFTLIGQYDAGGLEPGALAAADFDEDGRLDIAVCHQTSFSVSVLLGDGVGGLGPPFVASSLGVRPETLVTSDFDGDGILDLAVASVDSNNLALLRGRGDGTFQTYRFLAVGSAPRAIAAGDIDRDGSCDLVISRSGDHLLTVFLGDGTGEFTEGQSLPAEFTPNGLVLLDFDRDGWLDAFVATGFGSHVRMLRNQSGQLVEVAVMRVGEAPQFVLSEDFDRDGNPDLLTGNGVESTSSLTLILGQGLPGFITEHVQTLPVRIFDFVTGDLNGDGYDDLLAGSPTETKIELGDGQGGFQESILPISGAGASLGDLNEDGNLDLLAVVDETVVLYRGDGMGGFGEVQALPLIDVTVAAIGDIDGDGHLDLVARGQEDFVGRVVIALGDGNGGVLSTHLTQVAHSVNGLSLGDFDGDGLVDVALLRNERIDFHYGHGGGTLESAVRVGGFDTMRSFGAGDFNEDGLDDIVTADSFLDDLTVLLGTPSRQPQVLSPVPSGVGPDDLVVADFDEDGHLDVAALLHPGEPAAQLFRGLGTGELVRAGSFWIRDAARLMRGFDFDGDGHRDLVAASDGGCSPTCGPSGVIVTLRNRSVDHLDSRAGNVNASAGPVANVLTVNGSIGQGSQRSLDVARGESISLEILPPPSRQMKPKTNYAMYLFSGAPRPATVEILPFGVGRTCRSTPLTGGQPEVILSTFPGMVFGEPNVPSFPAPVVLSRARGLNRSLTLTLQGLIIDPSSPNGILAVTNAIVVRVR